MTALASDTFREKKSGSQCTQNGSQDPETPLVSARSSFSVEEDFFYEGDSEMSTTSSESSSRSEDLPEYVCTDSEAQAIREFYIKIANIGLLDIARPFKMQEELTALAYKFVRAHPFGQLEAAPPEEMKKALESSLPRISELWSFLFDSLKSCHSKNQLEPYVDTFAAQMKKSPEIIRKKMAEEDWKGLVHYLFDVK